MMTTAAMTSPIVGSLSVNLVRPTIPSRVALASKLLLVMSDLTSASTCSPNARATVTTTRVIPKGSRSPTSIDLRVFCCTSIGCKYSLKTRS